MGKFGNIAVSAYDAMKENSNLTCRDAWINAVAKLPSNNNNNNNNKCCPRNAFIGLCQNGRLKDIDCRNQCAKAKAKLGRNGIYANILADRFTSKNVLPGDTNKALWASMRTEAENKWGLKDPAQNDNGHIDVVRTLFDKGYLK